MGVKWENLGQINSLLDKRTSEKSFKNKIVNLSIYLCTFLNFYIRFIIKYIFPGPLKSRISFKYSKSTICCGVIDINV